MPNLYEDRRAASEAGRKGNAERARRRSQGQPSFDARMKAVRELVAQLDCPDAGMRLAAASELISQDVRDSDRGHRVAAPGRSAESAHPTKTATGGESIPRPTAVGFGPVQGGEPGEVLHLGPAE